MPIGWTFPTLGEIIIPTKGKRPKKLGNYSKKNTIPYITIQAFEKNKFEQYTNDKTCPRCNDKDVLIVWDGSRSGLVGTGATGVIGSTLTKLHCPQIFSKYLYYFLKTQYQKLNTNPKGIGIPHVNPNLLWNIEFPLSPLNEQKRIVSKIEELFSIIDNNQNILQKIGFQLKQFERSFLNNSLNGNLTKIWRKENPKVLSVSESLKKLKEKRLNEYLIECKQRKANGNKKPRKPINLEPKTTITNSKFQIPSTWGWIQLKYICQTRQYAMSSGPFGSSLGTKDYQKNGVPVIRTQNVKKGKIILENFVYVTESKADELKRSMAYPDDIVITAVGAYAGESAVIPETLSKAIVSQNCNKFTLDNTIGNPLYINRFLQHEIMRVQLREITTDTARKFLSLTNLKEIVIPLPPLAEQNVIIDLVENYFSIKNHLESMFNGQIHELNSVSFQILKKAFQGKLVSQDTKDEHAETLLKKIKEEKQKIIKVKQKSRRKKNVQ